MLSKVKKTEECGELKTQLFLMGFSAMDRGMEDVTEPAIVYGERNG